MSGPSLASATGSRVDSASKHIVPCKVHTDFMASVAGEAGDDALKELQVNKHNYCMAKDDVVIGLGRGLYSVSINSTKRKAYPAVITTLGRMDQISRRWHALHNFFCTGYMSMDQEMQLLIKFVDGSSTQDEVDAFLPDRRYAYTKLDQKTNPNRAAIVRNQLREMMDMYFCGIALGTAWAHPHTGDTVASVMIGGLRTVLNGGFQVSTGDLMMFYWPDERGLFEDEGGRIPRKRIGMENAHDFLDWEKAADFIMDGKIEKNAMGGEPVGTDKLRQAYYAQGNGNYNGKNQGKVFVAMIKPYVLSRHLDHNRVPEHFPCDKARIFGKAISNARPYEMVDIMIARQSL